MFQRNIWEDEVIEAVRIGDLIAEYPGDSPYPSCLILGNSKGRPLHVVVAMDEARYTCHVITAYIPDPAIWTADFKTKKKP